MNKLLNRIVYKIEERSTKRSSIYCYAFFLSLFLCCISQVSYANSFTYSGSFINTYLEQDILKNKLNYKKVYAFTDRLNEYNIPYDEGKSASIYDQSKQVDNALIQAILRYKISLSNTALEESYIRTVQKKIFLFQKIRILLPASVRPDTFNKALQENLSLWASRAKLKYDRKKEKSFIYIDEVMTHEISYTMPKSSAKLTIVIDDLGGTSKDAFELFSLEYPVSFSILPDTAHASLTAELAHFANREVYLHQPMAALKGRFVVDETFLISDSKEVLKKKLIQNFNSVPFATALNNHTGSAFTQNKAAVQRYLEVQKEVNPNIHILDSRTIADSKLFEEAKKSGFVSKQREVFIDNVQSKQAIEKQLNKALRIAIQTNSHIIVIGHPYKETIQALKSWKTYKQENVEIVRSFPYSDIRLQGLVIYPYVQSLPAPFVSAPSYQP